MKHVTAPERTVQGIYLAIMNNDEKALADALNMDGKLDTREILQYLKNQNLPAFHEKMQHAAGTVYRNGNPQTIRHEDGQDILKFRQQKKFGIYKAVNVSLTDVKFSGVANGRLDSKETIPTELLVDHAMYSTDWQYGDTMFHLYVVNIKDLPGPKVNEKEDDKPSYALFLAKDNETKGMLQIDGRIPFIVERENIGEYELGNQHFLGFIDNETSLVLWTLENGRLSPVLFDDQKSLTLNEGKFKFIEKAYLQTYEPVLGKDGWTFTTWGWEQDQLKFNLLHTESYTADRPYGLETGQHTMQLWNEYEDYYVAFPQYTFTEQSAELLKDGMLLHQDVQLGMPIEDVLQIHSNFYEHDYYAGGIYYSFPGGRTIFYDELAGDVTYITLNGGSLTNELEELLAILGPPENEGYDEMNDEYTYYYMFGQNQLRLDRGMDGRIISLWLSKRQN
ncbi:hypothetical protein [Sporosarcina sp. Te-1]|uniref:hypothetical protein n=1 Tax=Sporosarcina sp. Te-1 TaxID=2818390 RepID=UPI001A9DE667|nr:hypothetical protein [Sporosarcina sp. Te-1]QTD40939.1 hypothetical protein J3U78_19720 [Sporosarcina sp. Te-1]